MAYVKNTWVDQQGQVRYTETEDDGYKIFTANYDEVTELGTPVNATNMNHIEDGLALSDVMKYSSTVTYSLDEWVTGTVGGTKGIYKSLVNNNIGNALTDTTKWGKVRLGSSLKLGQSVWSPDPLIDSDLHLYNGSQYATNGIYADFVTRYLTPLKTDYPARFKTDAEWQTINTQYGACGFWVLDTENNVFRFPNIVGIIENTTTEADLGKLTEAGLPNIEGSIGFYGGSGSTGETGCVTQKSISGLANGGSGTYGISNYIDASLSSSIYGNSSTVQPQTISGYLYCVVATDQTPTEAETDINEIAADLALKADVDLSNINPTQTVKNTIIGWGMPDYANGISVTENTDYTCPSIGWVLISDTRANNGGTTFTINSVSYNFTASYGNYYDTNFAIIPVSKDDVVNLSAGTIKFFPSKGVN